jgi:hypothetical protein
MARRFPEPLKISRSFGIHEQPENATIQGVKNAPPGFVDWAKQKGAAISSKAAETRR